MTVSVLLFASYADALGQQRLTLDLPPGAVVRDALDRVRAMPGSDALPRSPLIAVNHQYAGWDHELSIGDEIALIPPVAGG